MKLGKDNLAIGCDNAAVRFPLIDPSQTWRLIFQPSRVRWFEALMDISIHVPRGKIIGVIGKNGAGKSTLLRTVAGVYPLSAGSLVKVGTVSTLFELGGMGGKSITGENYIRLWLRLNGVPKRKWDFLIEDVRAFSELGDRLKDKILTYSSGMAARLYFATATCVGNEIYLIDELLSVGDEHFQSKCWGRIRLRLKDGVSGILATHDWAAILRLCESTYELDAGRISSGGDSEKIIRNYLKLANDFDDNGISKISESCPTEVDARSGENWEFIVPIVVHKENTVRFSFSIEKLVTGKEWQIIILGEEVIVGHSVGRYLTKIRIEDLPLPRGVYRLNLFLTGRKGVNLDQRVTYDARSWTTGNSVELRVDGPSSQALILMPVHMEA